MNDTQVDVLVASTSSISDRQVAALGLGSTEAEILDAILALDPVELVGPVARNGFDARPPTPVVPLAGRPRHKPRRRLTMVAAAAALLVGAVIWQQGRPADRMETAVAAELLEIAETSPRLLLDRPAWSVEQASRDSMTFSDGTTELSVRWSAVSAHEADVAFLHDLVANWQGMGGLPGDPMEDVPPSERASVMPPLQVMGRDAVAIRRANFTSTIDSYEREDEDTYEAAWTLDTYSVRVLGTFATPEAFVDVLNGFHQVDIDTWLEAMPPNVIKPNGQQQAVDQILADIPLPPGFDPTAFRIDNELVESRDELGGVVTDAVACGWFDLWAQATDAGDAAGVQQAVDAMATSHSWPILVEMHPGDSYSIWTLADAMPTNALIPLSDGDARTPRDLYENWLHCKD